MANEIQVQETFQKVTSSGSTKKSGFALIGMGELTEHQLLPAFEHCNYATPTALVGEDLKEMKKLALKFKIPENNVYNYENFDSIKYNQEVDAVYIVLPNSLHKDFAIRAAKAGKHVLCEKPMSVNSEDAAAMIEVCQKENRKLMVAYRIQYEPHHQLMREWVQKEVFGKVKMLETFNGEYIGDASQWRFKKELAGGGVLMDLGIYCINTMRFLKGDEPQWVSASISSTPGDERFTEVEENVSLNMGFADGTIAVCGTSYSAYECQHYRGFTNNAWFGMEPAYAYEGLKIKIAVKDETDNFPVPFIPEVNQFALVIDHMATCIIHDKTPDTPGEEGLKDHFIMEAVYRSAKEKKIIELNNFQTTDI